MIVRSCCPRVVAQCLVVEVEVDRVEPEAIDASLEPPPRDGERFLLDLLGVEVQIGLGRQEVVQVVLISARLEGPRGTTKDGEPVVGGSTVFAGIGPDVAVTEPALLGLSRGNEPGMTVRGVARADRSVRECRGGVLR